MLKLAENMKKIMFLGVLTILLLTIIPASISNVSSSQTSDIKITPKISVKGPQAKGKPVKTISTGILGFPPPNQNNRWAVIIGISDYGVEGNDIEYADDDALDVLKVLTIVYGYKRENIRLLISDYSINNATKTEIIEAINWLRDNETPDSEVLFFYSGHGARGKANDGDKELVDEAIVPYECTSDCLIWDGELKEMFSEFDTSRIIFIFDSCYSGGRTDLKGNGRIVIMACSESGLSYEGPEWGNGQFTYYFADEGMFNGEADIYDHDEDGTFSERSDVVIEEAFDYAKARCQYQAPIISDLFSYDLLP